MSPSVSSPVRRPFAAKSAFLSRLLLSAAALPLFGSVGCYDTRGTLEPVAAEDSGLESTEPVVTLPKFATTLLGLNPVGYWRFEEDGDAALDSSGRNHHGSYRNSAQRTGGAVAGNAVALDSASKQYVEIPDHDDFSLVKAQDAFARTEELGSDWGEANHGGAWVSEFSTGAYYSLDGDHARIHQTKAATYGQSIALERADVDVQVKVSWDQAASDVALRPVSLLARMQDAVTYYSAELRENVGGQLDLRIRRTTASENVELKSAKDVGAYQPGDVWFVRFQVEGTNLRAKAWKEGSAEPNAWSAVVSDSVLSAAGRIGIRSSNVGSAARPVVSFDDFRVQSVGMTVHAFVRPDQLEFDADYIHWLGKGEKGNHEWAFRLYSQDEADRPSRLSAYSWNASGGLGAGAYFEDALSAGQWLEVVALFDAGDALDTSAGVTLYRDGVKRKGPPSSGTLYSNADYHVMPANGAAPLRLGTRDLVGFLGGALDEVAVFDRKLSEAEIQALHEAAQ